MEKFLTYPMAADITNTIHICSTLIELREKVKAAIEASASTYSAMHVVLKSAKMNTLTSRGLKVRSQQCCNRFFTRALIRHLSMAEAKNTTPAPRKVRVWPNGWQVYVI